MCSKYCPAQPRLLWQSLRGRHKRTPRPTEYPNMRYVHLDHFRQYVLPHSFNMTNIKLLSVFQIVGLIIAQGVLVFVGEHFKANGVTASYIACVNVLVD